MTLIEPWYPAWAPWILWPLVLAAGVVVFTEPLKWVLYKTKWAPFRKVWTRQKSHYAKAQLLVPFKALLGALGGFFLFRAGGLFDSGLLASAFGGAIGTFSFTLYDGVVKVLRYLPEVIKARLGRLGAGPPNDSTPPGDSTDGGED